MNKCPKEETLDFIWEKVSDEIKRIEEISQSIPKSDYFRGQKAAYGYVIYILAQIDK